MKRRKLFARYGATGGPSSAPGPGRASGPLPGAAIAPGGPMISPGPGPGPGIGPGPQIPGAIPAPGPGDFPTFPYGLPEGFSPNPNSTDVMSRMAYPEIYDRRYDVINKPYVYLPNEGQVPPIDKSLPLHSFDKAVRLGWQPQPRSIAAIARGDAFTGDSMFRSTQIYARMDDPVALSVANVVQNHSIGLATQRMSDNRPRIWHVSVYGMGVVDEVVVPTPPLTREQILNQQFVGNFGPGLAAAASTAPYVQRIMNFKARAMIFDEAGFARYFDFDVLGTRSFDVFAFGIAIFMLVPDTGYEVNIQNPDGNPPLTGLVQNAIVGARILPATFASSFAQRNQTHIIPLSGAVGSMAKMPIPPGARQVRLINHSITPAGADYDAFFDAGGSIGSAALTNLGAIVLDPVLFRTDLIEIPNANFILFTTGAAAAATSFSAVFTVDA